MYRFLFIHKLFCLQSLGKMNPKLNVMAEGAVNNMKQWAKLVTEENYNKYTK